MKNIRNFIFMFMLLFIAGVQCAKAESTVYFFIDFRFWNSEYQFKVNGKDTFKIIPEGKPVVKGGAVMYNMGARKVIFKHSDSYVISSDCPSPQGDYHAELNLNLEDGETYYVLINATLKRTFYIELLDEKQGLKLLKKAQSSSKYTFNEDFIYENE